MVRNLLANVGHVGLIPESGRSSGEGNGNPLQYSCLGNPWTEDLAGYSPWVHKRVGHDLVLNTNAHINYSCFVCLGKN